MNLVKLELMISFKISQTIERFLLVVFNTMLKVLQVLPNRFNYSSRQREVFSLNKFEVTN